MRSASGTIHVGDSIAVIGQISNLAETGRGLERFIANMNCAKAESWWCFVIRA